MKVTLLDTKTGRRHETGDNYDPFWWAEGNGSCDCNRRLMMGEDTAKPEGYCEGCERFLIVAANDDSYSLRELNEDYPLELLKAHGVVV